MAKDLYYGIDGKARKIKAVYVGVNGVARKVKAGYLGVGNVARPFFSSAFKVTINAPANAKIVVTPEASVITSIPAFEVAKGTTKVIDYPAGKTIKLECVPDEGYAFSEWDIQPPPTIAETPQDLYAIDCTITPAYVKTQSSSTANIGYDNYSTKYGNIKLNKELPPNNIFAPIIEEVNALYSSTSSNLINLRFKPMVLIDGVNDIIVTRKDTNRSVKLQAQSYGAYLTQSEGNFFTEADIGKEIRVIISAEHIFNK